MPPATETEVIATAPAADAVSQKADEAKPVETKTVLSGAETAASEAKAGDEAAVSETASAEIVYDIKAPQGVDLDPVAVTSFVEFAKAEKLPADLAQKIVEYGVKHQAKIAAESEKSLADSVLRDEASGFEELKKDPELGGANYEQTLKLAAEGFQKFATKDEIEFIDSTRLGNRIPMIKLFRRVALAFREDKVVGKGTNAGPTGKIESEADLHRALYPNSPELFGETKTE